MDIIIYSLEDDADIALIINKTLTKQGYKVETFYNGDSFFKRFEEQKPHIILLDMMLPDVSGLDVLKNIRSNPLNKDIQILIISAKTDLTTKVDGLDLGADDYIEKPFNILELMSRVGSKVRRINSVSESVLSYKSISLDLTSRTCYKNGVNLNLTSKEIIILEALIRSLGKTVTREQLYNTIWGNDTYVESRALDMHVKSIRSKIEDDEIKISTVYGIGYRFNV